MGGRPVSYPATSADSWKLAEPHASQAQGMIVSGYNHLPVSQTLFLEFDWDSSTSGGAWLKALEGIAPVTAADGKKDPSVGLGITATGLIKMGVEESVMAGFSAPFLEGMFQVDRMRRLNDRVGTEWSSCVREGGPLWSANTPPPQVHDTSGLMSTLPRRDDTSITTPITVDAMLILFCKDSREGRTWSDRVTEVLARCGVKVVRHRETNLEFDKHDMVREHFGFGDGLSQPIPWDPKAIEGAGRAPDHVNGIALGDILLGHVDGHHETTVGPMVTRGSTHLDDPDDPDNLDLGLNGSYLVVRELWQDVAGFWNNAAEVERELGLDSEARKERPGTWVAERIIGRAMSGDVLRPGGVADRYDPKAPANDFLFFDDDFRGLGCPLGSHMRRGNPRDGLATKASQKDSLLASSNRHRFLRRGRKFGPRIADPMVDDGAERGLIFLIVNADIERQFEFVQQVWMMSPSFGTLFDETDPLIGPGSRFTIGAEPVRRRADIANFTKLAGGEYFFLPSLPAIKWLSEL
ncbi:hypothetical protein [Qipengyuania sphaerica]|uniref:hypothetical protein n=1 Tax=Qipengyuania sphaerica TaxID=2867243 RepID=UPI001C886CE6|nr:hypothetical protein [Qipengyuania sphaerica]MBX7541230.1 hypothetical protein [Qipengyuania sphaerica]